MKNLSNNKKYIYLFIMVVLISLTIVFLLKPKHEKISEKNGISFTETPVKDEVVPETVAIAKPSDKIPISDTFQDITKFYQTGDFQDFYGRPVTPPPFNFNVNLEGKTLFELRVLENEIYARHNYLFQDAVMRGYFNQFKWYQPIFWVNNYKISLNDIEKNFVKKVSEKEMELLRNNYIAGGAGTMANMKNVVNFSQFKRVPDTLMRHINADGFAIVPARNLQLYQVYDQNQYDAVPSFITSDVYLQLMHMDYSNMIKHLEEHFFIPAIKTLVLTLYSESMKMCTNNDPGIKEAACFNSTYYALAYYLISDQKKPVPASMQKMYAEEIQRLIKRQGFNTATGRGSGFLQDTLFDYTQLKPRGFYTRTSELKHYFACMKWMLTAPMFLVRDKQLKAAILSAQMIATKKSGDKSLLTLFNSITEPVNFLVGKADNLSMTDLINILEEKKLTGQSPANLVTPSNLALIKSTLKARDPERIKMKGINDQTDKMLSQKSLFFMPGRYTFDAEILQRLVEVTAPDPKRPFPKGLDIFAALGNTASEKILKETYRETEGWPGYSDTLETLKKQFSGFKDWDKTAYNKSMEGLNILQQKDNSMPYYMQTTAWSKKTLNTSLAYWAEMKHDVILYAKQSGAAEAGEGGGPEPPVYPGYVEPDVKFWQNCLTMLTMTSERLKKYNMIDEDLNRIDSSMRELCGFFLKISEKELKNEPLTRNEFNRIVWIGGEFEMITQHILGSDRQLNEEDNPDRYAAVVADVYTYQDECLEEATGWGDEIYVVAEINGYLYLTRGAVFSYREFTQPSSGRLTDEEWHKMMEGGDVPKAPVWMEDITAHIQSLDTKPWYTYSANPTGMKEQ